MRAIAEIYRIGVVIAGLIFIGVGIWGASILTNYSSRDDLQGIILIGFSVAGILLLGPSAILLAIMDDVSGIRLKQEFRYNQAKQSNEKEVDSNEKEVDWL